MLAPHFDEGFIGALNDALAADIDPAARGHLAVHHQALFIELVAMLPTRPSGDEVRIGEREARSEEPTSAPQSMMRISSASFCLNIKMTMNTTAETHLEP